MEHTHDGVYYHDHGDGHVHSHPAEPEHTHEHEHEHSHEHEHDHGSHKQHIADKYAVFTAFLLADVKIRMFPGGNRVGSKGQQENQNCADVNDCHNIDPPIKDIYQSYRVYDFENQSVPPA